MEQIIEYYLKQLESNKDLPEDVKEHYHEIIDTYAHAVLSAMIS